MVRLLLFAAIVVIGWRLVIGRWPWEQGAVTRRSNRAPDREKARILLGVPADASREDIIEAHKRLVAMVHPDRGGTNEAVHEANDARDVLLAQAALRNTEQS